MKLTLKEAADAVGRNKSTVFRAIREGKLIATKNENGLIFIESSDLHNAFPAEDMINRMETKKRGRPVGSRKNNNMSDALSSPSPLAQEILRLEKENTLYKQECEMLKARLIAETTRLSDIMLERERITTRMHHLEKELDNARADNIAKDGRLYELRSEKDKLALRIESLETTLRDAMNESHKTKALDSKEKKSLFEKIFA